MQQYDFPRNPFNFELTTSKIYIGLGILVFIWLASGIYIVDPGEQGVVRRYGKMVGVPVDAGLHWHFPSPIETVDTPTVDRIRRIEVGFRTISQGPPARYRNVPSEAEMLTGDENIVGIWIAVQYRIKDAANYLFKIKNSEITIKVAAEAALRQVVGNHKIDEALTEGKALIQTETEQELQRILDIYESGIAVVTVKLQEVFVPKEVDQAFKDVASAREDRERLKREAEGYQNDVIPKARGNAEKLIKGSEAYKVERVNRAQGDAHRFLQVLAEYKKAKKVTKTRLYLETMEKVLPGLQKYVIKAEGNSGILNVLPLERAIGKGGGR